MIGCLSTQALAFLAVFVYATQAIAFEWKPGLSVTSFSQLFYSTCLTDPLPVESKSDKRWRNGEIIDDGVDVHPTDQLVVGGNQLKPFSANH